MEKPKKKMSVKERRKYMKEKAFTIRQIKKKKNDSFIELVNVTNELAKLVPDVEETQGVHATVSAPARAVAGATQLATTSATTTKPLTLPPEQSTAMKVTQDSLQQLEFIDDTHRLTCNNISSDKNAIDDDELHIEVQGISDADMNTEISEESDERRIVDLKYFLRELKNISSHSKAFGCSIDNLELTREKRLGLMSTLQFKCKMCNVGLKINTCKPSPNKNLNVNTAVVTSAAVAGVGFTQLQEVFASINVPFMSEALYKKVDDRVNSEWEKVASAEMDAAALREKQCALDEGRVNADGIPKQINDLYVAISNSYNHAFGCHTHCQDFYCKSKKNSEDITIKFKNTLLENQIKLIIGFTAANARSLIEDVDSNRCEQFNAIIAKCIGGKRVNYCLRGSYQARCATAVVSFNTKRPLYKLQKSILGVSPSSKSKCLELKKLKKNSRKSNARRQLVFRQNEKKTQDENYGTNCMRPDLPGEDLEMLKNTFLETLAKSKEDIVNIEKETVLQSESSKWLEIRRNLLTASNFGKVVNKRSSTSASLVASLLYKKNLSEVTSIQHGKMNEKHALKQLEQQENVQILPCGLFIDEKYPFLGATPDGVIDEKIIVEIKCPISGHRSSLEEAIKSKKITFWNTSYEINKKHHWYLQVQGQLNITGREKCLFGVWTGLDRPIKTEIIERDENLWNNTMVPKLKDFYMESLLPELLDPRKTRNMPLREINIQTTNKTTTKRKQNSESTQHIAKNLRIQMPEQEMIIDFKDM